MKAKHFILPAAALVIGAVILGGQRKRISDLRADSAELRARIAEAQEGGGGDPFHSRSARENTPSAGKEPIDWSALAEQIREGRREEGIGRLRAMLDLENRLMAMDTPELLAALDQIAALDLDEATRMELEAMIAGQLSKKDPELALERFKHRLDDPGRGMVWHLSWALERLAEKDLGAAISWMTREISAGTFDAKSLDGRNPLRVQFETKLLSRMLKVDPSLAATRLSGMDMALRKDALEAIRVDRLSPEEQVAHADLIRRQLNAADQLAALNGRAANLARQKGFTEVDAYLDRIAATPEERRESADAAAAAFLNGKRWQGNLKEADIDAMREWTAKNAPEAVGRLTGQGVAEALNQDGGMDFPEASALALRYAGSDGGDDVLVGFLEKVSSQHKSGARELAAKISDPQRRERMLQQFK